MLFLYVCSEPKSLMICSKFRFAFSLLYDYYYYFILVILKYSAGFKSLEQSTTTFFTSTSLKSSLAMETVELFSVCILLSSFAA